MERVLWAKVREREEVWVEAVEIVKAQAREEIVFALPAAQRHRIKQELRVRL